MPKLPSSKSEEADTSIHSKLTSKMSSKQLRVVLARMLRKLKSKKEELPPRRPRNDPSYLNTHNFIHNYYILMSKDRQLLYRMIANI